MLIGDSEWRSRAASIIRDARRVIDRDFAKFIASWVREAIRTRSGEPVAKSDTK